MAMLEGRPRVEARISITLNESEAAALDALAGYGTDAFLEVFYKYMGSAYLKPHESGLRSLFDSVHGGDANVSNILQRFSDARRVLSGERIAVPKPPKDEK